jgi:hypothetical protein
MRLFFNPDQEIHLRGLADEFGVSTNLVREELKQLADSGLLVNRKAGRQINFRANKKHPLFPELHSMVRKAFGMDQILESIIGRLGDLKLAFLMDDYAEGKDTGIIDLLFVGNIDQNNLHDLIKKTERYISRKIRPLVLKESEYIKMRPILEKRPMLELWRASDMEHDNNA